MNGAGAEREGDTESETGSRLRAISPEPDAGLELTDLAEVRRLTADCATQAPQVFSFQWKEFEGVQMLIRGSQETEAEDTRMSMCWWPTVQARQKPWNVGTMATLAAEVRK